MSTKHELWFADDRVHRYIDVCKLMKKYWKFHIIPPTAAETSYLDALNALRYYLDGIGWRMPDKKHADVDL